MGEIVIVNKEDLVEIANMIRTSTGNTDTLNVDEIKAILTQSDYSFVDLSEDTVTVETLAEGITAHDANGNQITGTMVAGSGDNESFNGIISRTATNPTLPEDLTAIGAQAFTAYTALTSLSIPGSVVSIGDYAFNSCSGLTTITFEGTPSTISSTAFYSCSNLRTINVPWSFGAVAGAPWSASNATINYNYT